MLEDLGLLKKVELLWLGEPFFGRFGMLESVKLKAYLERPEVVQDISSTIQTKAEF